MGRKLNFDLCLILYKNCMIDRIIKIKILKENMGDYFEGYRVGGDICNLYVWLKFFIFKKFKLSNNRNIERERESYSYISVYIYIYKRGR